MTITVNAPSEVSYYQPDRDSFSIVWKMNPQLYLEDATIEDISLYDFILQIDVVNTFDSINLKEYTTTSPQVTYQNGYFYKAFVFDNFRAMEDVTYYYRVKVSSTSYLSAWSDIGSFTKDKVTYLADSDFMKNNLPDKNVYTQQGLRNYFTIFKAYAKEVEAIKGELGRVGEDVNFDKTQDSDFYDVLGVLLQTVRNTTRPWIEYRNETLALWESFLKAGTTGGIKKFINSIMGVDTEIITYKNRYGWIVDDVQRAYIEETNPYWNVIAQYYLPDPAWSSLTVLPQANSRGEKAFTWVLKIYNPFSVTTRRTMIEYIISKIKPVNTLVYFQYFNNPVLVTAGFGDSFYWGGGRYWGTPELIWTQYFPND